MKKEEEQMRKGWELLAAEVDAAARKGDLARVKQLETSGTAMIIIIIKLIIVIVVIIKKNENQLDHHQHYHHHHHLHRHE